MTKHLLLRYNSYMNKQDRIYAVWAMNGAYYDAIMNSCPAWVLNSDLDFDFDDWFYSQIGL